jgi:membrane fusion protein (multidrug efflux system)
MAEPQSTGNGQGRKKAFMIVGAVVTIGLLAGFAYKSYRKTHITTDDAFIEGNIHTIAAKVNGTVRSIHVTDNQSVRKGDLLIEIDPSDYDVRLHEAASALGVERAKFVEADTRIAAARANLELQKANLRLAELDKNRMESLFQQDVVPKDRYDRAMTAWETALAQVKTAEEQLRQAESQKVTQSSTIRQKEAAAALAGLNLQYTRIQAPADGYVTKKTVQEGNQIQAGQPLMAVVSLDDLWVTANFKETELERIRPGQKVRIAVDTYPGRVFTGVVDSIMAGTGVTFSLFPAENATGNYVKVVQRIPVKIRLDAGSDKDHILRVGMSVEPTVLAK